MLKLTTDKHEASRGLSATAELLVLFHLGLHRVSKTRRLWKAAVSISTN